MPKLITQEQAPATWTVSLEEGSVRQQTGHVTLSTVIEEASSLDLIEEEGSSLIFECCMYHTVLVSNCHTCFCDTFLPCLDRVS